MVRLPERFDAETLWAQTQSESLERVRSFHQAVHQEQRIQAGELLESELAPADAARLIKSTNHFVRWMDIASFHELRLPEAPERVFEAFRQRVERWRKANPDDPNWRATRPSRYEYTIAILDAHLNRTLS